LIRKIGMSSAVERHRQDEGGQRAHGFSSNVAAPCRISAKEKVDPTKSPTLLTKRALREAVETWLCHEISAPPIASATARKVTNMIQPVPLSQSA
jgi:hypothetical protein